jgi:H+/gluconate symporter-like permease
VSGGSAAVAVATVATGRVATGAGMLVRARRAVPRATLLLNCKLGRRFFRHNHPMAFWVFGLLTMIAYSRGGFGRGRGGRGDAPPS